MLIALVSDVFFGPDGPARLAARLDEGRARGAALAVLPELPLNPWSPATRDARDEDAEAPEGPRHRTLASAARAAGVAVIGGAIVRDPSTGARHNTALVFDAGGSLVSSYRKLHLPEEPGFWETSHYAPGDRPPVSFAIGDMRMGVQICSDVNRPEGSFLLAAQGAAVIAAPRATEAPTWERWKLVLRAIAMTAAAYVLTVNRQEPGLEVPLGGPAAAFDPAGQTLIESLDPVTVVGVDPRTADAARRDYPGYLPLRARVYEEGWAALSGARDER